MLNQLKKIKIMNTSVETKKDELRNNIKNVLESATSKAKSIISVCPEWEVTDVCPGYESLIAYLELKGAQNRRLEIRYQAKAGSWQDEAFETNVASCGSFDLLQASDNHKYYTAIGDILNHKDMLALLKETMVFYSEKITKLRKEYDKED